MGDLNIRIKALSTNNKVERYLTTQNRVAPPKYPKRIGGITIMKATQQRIISKAVLPGNGNHKAYTTTDFI
jgi:hypothetical protein